MTKKFPLLLLDANVVIELFRQGLWENVVGTCDVHLARTIVEAEARFFQDQAGIRRPIDLASCEGSGTVNVFDVALSELTAFTSAYDITYVDRLDPGETESLVHLLARPDPCQICSADSIVFKVLGNLARGEQGVSLEEVLHRAGLTRKLAWQYTKAFRDRWTAEGFRDRLAGIGRDR